MATWHEFSRGGAELQRPGIDGAPVAWEPFDGGAAALAAAGERLFKRGELALLGTVSAGGRPRIHPFIPRIVDGRLWAFVIGRSPKMRDLLMRPYTIHALPGDEDEEFWVSGRARRADDAASVALVTAAMPYKVRPHEILFEFELELAVWTTWIGFGTDDIHPVHHRWRATAG
jgi:hypothetical protein